jgi:hypothetical protein
MAAVLPTRLPRPQQRSQAQRRPRWLHQGARNNDEADSSGGDRRTVDDAYLGDDGLLAEVWGDALPRDVWTAVALPADGALLAVPLRVVLSAR